MDTAPNALSLDVNEFVLDHWRALPDPPASILSPSRHSPRLTHAAHEPEASLLLTVCSRSMEKASPSPSRGRWLTSRARVAPSHERIDVDACLGESFNSSTASFIYMDSAELFSMRWTTDDTGVDSGLPPPASSAGDLLPRGPIGVAYADVSSSPSPAFHSARSTPASASSGSRRVPGATPRTAPLLAARRLLLGCLRFLVPLCRKARSLAPRSGVALAATAPARRSASSVAAEQWCHGNADTAVRDAILYCKKSFTARAEC